jgi:hypothetical protein
MEDLIHMGELALDASFSGLAKKRRELKCFTDCAGLDMNVHLLTVADGVSE